jgi:hypothetical protein
MIYRKTIFCLLMCIVFSVALNAQSVNTMNGNFSISYTDVSFEDSIPFEITRIYNSKSVEKGWFGIGWGGPYESYLSPIPGGGVVIFYWRTGAKLVFRPNQWNNLDITSSVDKMVSIATTKLEVKTPEEIQKLKNELLESEEKRINYWVKYLQKGLLQPVLIPENSRLASVTPGFSYLQVTKEGYTLPQEEDGAWYFDKQGRFLKKTDGKGNFISFFYGKTSYPDSIQDNWGNKLKLLFNGQNLLQQIECISKDGKKDTSFYTYNKDAETLSSSKDIEGNFYRFEWDNDYNLLKVLYTDGADMQIAYDDNYFATSVKKRNGSRTTYEYPQNSPDDYGNTVTYYDSLGKKIKMYSNWYVIKTNEIGMRWQYKWITVRDADSTTYINNERFELADTVYRNKGRYYAYTYDNKGNLTTVTGSGGLHVKVETAQGKLKKLVTNKNIYTVVYKDKRVEKFITQTGDEIRFPLEKPLTEPKKFKEEIKLFLPAFMASLYWYDLYITDELLAESNS